MSTALEDRLTTVTFPPKRRALGFTGKILDSVGGLVSISLPSNQWIEDYDPLTERFPTSRADLFTFSQRYPDITPRFPYSLDWDSLAVLKITGYEFWRDKQIGKKTRNLLRKSEKKNVTVKVLQFGENLVQAIEQIYNETPVRQNKPFRHFGEKFEDIKNRFSSGFNARGEFAAAFIESEIVGFIQLIYTDSYALLSQIISYVKYRDCAINNAPIAKAVQICAENSVPFLVHERFGKGGLVQFKVNNGFEEKKIPRYYIPLSTKGKMILSLGLQTKITPHLP